MTSPIKLVASIAMISFLSVSIFAQAAAGPELMHFAAHGISFDYPSGYSITDHSTTEAQQLIITRKESSFQISIIVMRRPLPRNELAAAIENFTEPETIAITLDQSKTPPERISFQTQVGSKQAEGVRLQSTDSNGRTGELIWSRLSFHLVGLALIRSNVDDSGASQLGRRLNPA